MAVHLLFGRTRWARRRGVAALLRGQEDAAFVMGTWRKREQLLRELARAPGRRGAEPVAWVFGHLVESLLGRFVDDRAPLTPGAALVLARRALAEAAEPALGDDFATAAALVDAVEAWGQAGRAPDDPVARRAVRAAGRAFGASGALRTRAQGLELLLQALRDPSAALQRWLARHPAVVIDDLCGLSPLESAVATALCAALDAAGSTVVLSFAIGRDRGGREIAWALGVEPPEDREAAVFTATRALRERAFEDLVATGLAEVHAVGPLGVRPVDLVDEDGPAAPPDLADHVAAGIPLDRPLPPGGLALTRFADPEAEATEVARALVALLADGLDPRDALVAVADPAIEPTLARVLDDHEIPWSRGGGRPVGPLPAVQAAGALLALRADGLPLDEVLAFAAFAGAGRPSLGAALRAAGVASGDPATWAPALTAFAPRARAPLAPLLADRDAVLAALAHLPDPTPTDGAGWAGRLRAAWAAVAGDDPLRDAVDGALAAAGDDLALAGPGPFTAEEARAVLAGHLAALVRPEPDDGVARVPVVGAREILGLTPRHVFLVGLRAGAWVSPRARGPLALPPGIGRDALAEARYLLHSLLRDAVGDPWMRGVHLSWPAAVDGRPQRPAPLLADLLELRVGVGRLADHLAAAPSRPVASRSDRRRACAASEEDPVARVAWARRGPPGAHDGHLGSPITSPGALPVTALETWLRCPHRYWVRHRLGLDALVEDDPELDPRRRGTALHRILEAFYRERGLRPVADDPDPAPARAALAAVAARVLDEVEAEGGIDPLFHGYARARWLAGLTDDRPAGLLRVWLDQERARPRARPVAVESPFRDLPAGPITLRGTIDRIDTSDGAHLVIDYKTGRPPTREEVLAGLSLQPFAYLATVAPPAAACFQVLSRPDRLARAAFVGDPAALDVHCAPSERRAAREVSPDARAAVLADAGRAAAQLLAGAFPPTPHPPALAGCPSCPYRTACRRDARHAAPGAD